MSCGAVVLALVLATIHVGWPTPALGTGHYRAAAPLARCMAPSRSRLFYGGPWLLSCGDVDVTFKEDFHDGQGGPLRISTGDAGADPTRTRACKVNRSSAGGRRR
jgi:hypothetical protein